MEDCLRRGPSIKALSVSRSQEGCEGVCHQEAAGGHFQALGELFVLTSASRRHLK